jgi:hypothetical protein
VSSNFILKLFFKFWSLENPNYTFVKFWKKKKRFLAKVHHSPKKQRKTLHGHALKLSPLYSRILQGVEIPTCIVHFLHIS